MPSICYKWVCLWSAVWIRPPTRRQRLPVPDRLPTSRILQRAWIPRNTMETFTRRLRRCRRSGLLVHHFPDHCNLHALRDRYAGHCPLSWRHVTRLWPLWSSADRRRPCVCNTHVCNYWRSSTAAIFWFSKIILVTHRVVLTVWDDCTSLRFSSPSAIEIVKCCKKKSSVIRCYQSATVALGLQHSWLDQNAKNVNYSSHEFQDGQGTTK